MTLSASEIIRKVQRDVAIFEDPLPWFLTPCISEVSGMSEVTDPVEFAAVTYNLVRRVEAAAAKYAGEDEPRIRDAARRVKLIIPDISAMQERVKILVPTTPLEDAGKESLMERLGWALWILQERLPEWGY